MKDKTLEMQVYSMVLVSKIPPLIQVDAQKGITHPINKVVLFSMDQI